MRVWKVVAALVALVVLVLWIGGAALVDAFTPWALASAERAIGRPVAADDLDLRLWPPSLEVRGLEIGAPPAAGLAWAKVELDAYESLRRRRGLIVVEARGVSFDAEAFAASGEAPPTDSAGGGTTTQPPAQDEDSRLPPLPPIDLTLDATDLTLRSEAGWELDAAGVALSIESQGLGRASLQGGGQTLALRRDDRTATVDTVRLLADYHRGLVQVRDFHASASWMQFDAVPKGEAVASQTPRPFLGFGWIGRLAPVALSLESDLRPVAELGGEEAVGQLSADVVVGGPLANLDVAGSVRLQNAEWRDWSIDLLGLEVTRRQRRWHARDLVVRAPPGGVTGTLAFDESTQTVEAALRTDELHLDRLKLPVAELPELALAGRLDAEVALADWTGELAGDLSVQPPHGESLPLVFTLASDGTSLRGHAEMNLGGGRTIDADLQRASADALQGSLSARVHDWAPVFGLLGWTDLPAVTGDWKVDAEISGLPGHPRVDARVAAVDVTVDGADLGNVGAQAVLEGQQIRFDELVMDGAAGRMTGGGSVALDASADQDWQLTATELDVGAASRIAGVAAELRGRADLEILGRGRWSELSGEGRLQFAELLVGGSALRDAVVEVEANAGEWTLRADAASGDNGGVVVMRAGGAGRTVGHAGFEVDDWLLASDGVAAKIDGRGDLRALREGSGGSLQLRASELTISGMALGDFDANARGEAGRWEIRGSLDGDGTVLEARVDEATRNFDGELVFSGSDLGRLQVGAYQLTPQVSGTVKLRGNLARLADATGELDLRRLVLAGGAETLHLREPLLVRVERGGWTLPTAALEGDRSVFEVTASGPSSGAYRGEAKGVVDLAWLGALGPGLAGSKGPASVAASLVREPQGTPALEATVAIDDGGIELGDVAYADEVKGVVQIADGLVRTDGVSARLGGGKVALSGSVGSAVGANLDWQLRGVALSPVPSAEALVSGYGTLRGAWEEATLSGTVEIAEMLYDRNFSYQDLVPSFDRALDPAPRDRSERPPLALDLRVVARDGLHIDNNIARMEARADLHVGGTARRPVLDGKVRVIDGRVQLRGRTFEVVNGVLAFRPERRRAADIDFLAETLVDTGDLTYALEVRVSGSTDNYRIDLLSEDGLSQTDVASLIAFGKTVAQLQSGDDRGDSGGAGFSMDQVASFAGDRVGRMLGDEVQTTLPFDEVELRPGFSPTSGEFEPQIRVGKRVTESLSAWIAQTFGVQSQTAVEVGYELSPRTSTLLRWESKTTSQEGGVGGEISQQLDFWGLPDWLSWGETYGGTLE